MCARTAQWSSTTPPWAYTKPPDPFLTKTQQLASGHYSEPISRSTSVKYAPSLIAQRAVKSITKGPTRSNPGLSRESVLTV